MCSVPVMTVIVGIAVRRVFPELSQNHRIDDKDRAAQEQGSLQAHSSQPDGNAGRNNASDHGPKPVRSPCPIGRWCVMIAHIRPLMLLRGP